MKEGVIRVTLCLLVAIRFVPVTPAQQLSHLAELRARYEEFNRLYTQKRRAGANVASIELIRQQAEAAFKSGNVSALLETISRGIAVLEGKQLDEKQRFLSSLALKVDRLVVDSNQDLQVILARMFPTNPDQAFTQPPTVTFELKPEEPSPAESGTPTETTVAQRSTPPILIGERMAISQESTIATRRLRLTDGVYWIVARIESAGQSIIELTKPIYAINDFADRLSRLSSLVSVIKNSVDPKVKAVAPQVSTPFFQLQRLAGLNQTRGLYEINALGEFERIESILSALAQGVNPFANERGEVERAYQAEGILVPYRLYIPQSYDGTSARPLVILLHGTFGDERSYFSGLYDPAIIKGESERRGAILLAINRTARPGAPSGQDDAFEAINSVVRDYKIDPSRLYLTGHSTGALGSLIIASAKPDLFAAMALVSTGASAQTEAIGESLAKAKAIPTLVIHGAKDGIAAVENSRKLSSAAQKAGLKVEFIEVPETDHFSVVGTTFPAVMQFFERNARKPVAR